MAIADTLTELATDISNAYDSIDDKGGTLPQSKNTNNLATAIDSIPSGTMPSGTINITQNGTVDVTQYASANVDVSNVRTLTAEVTAYASYSSLAGFINAYGSFISQRQSNEIIYFKFVDNTTNTRAGIDGYILLNGDGVSRRRGTSGAQGAENGLDVYAGCTIEFNYIAMLGV